MYIAVNHTYVRMHIVDKSLLWLVHGICTQYISRVPAKGGIYLLCILATQNQLLFVEVYQINQVLSKSVSTSSVLGWYMGNVLRSVPLMLPSIRIHVCMYTVVYCMYIVAYHTYGLMYVHCFTKYIIIQVHYCIKRIHTLLHTLHTLLYTELVL